MAIQGSVASAPTARPAGTTAAAAIMIVMGVGGILSAALHLLLTVDGLGDFAPEASRAGGDAELIETVETGVRSAAITGVVLSAIVGILLVTLAVAVRNGVRPARIATWVLCAVGLCGGFLSVLASLLQRDLGSQDPPVAAVLRAAGEIYPAWWVGAGIGLAVAQVVGYFLVAVLLALGRGEPPAPLPSPIAAPPSLFVVPPNPDPTRSPWAAPPPSR